MVGHLNAIGYYHRVKIGYNPVLAMPRVSLMVRGLRRAKGPTQRKLPISLEDLREVKNMMDLAQIDQYILWETTLAGRFFMLRMSEFLGSKNPNLPTDRHPLRMSDIDPLCGGKLAHWGNHVGEATIHISGSKNDWLNRGCARSHTRVSDNSPNHDICVARALIGLYEIYPSKFNNNRDGLLAT